MYIKYCVKQQTTKHCFKMVQSTLVHEYYPNRPIHLLKFPRPSLSERYITKLKIKKFKYWVLQMWVSIFMLTATLAGCQKSLITNVQIQIQYLYTTYLNLFLKKTTIPTFPSMSPNLCLYNQLSSPSGTYLSWVSLVVVSLSVNGSFSSPREKCLSTSCSSSTTQLLSAFLCVCLWKIFSSIVPVYKIKKYIW